ncbi:hypothetical protein GQX74_005764 [Glossina fuscipes]|nr:hypothetical protein GQX74_005764 [Glossina fuscipes]
MRPSSSKVERLLLARDSASQKETLAVIRNHLYKTKYGFDRVVEDYIQEAMPKGDFNNLSGAGKPLSNAQTQNPYLDFTTHKLNKILLDNGFTPEWITLYKLCIYIMVVPNQQYVRSIVMFFQAHHREDINEIIKS